MASKSFSLIRKNKGKKNDGSSSPTKANSAGTAKETAPAAAKGSTIKVNVDQAALNAARSLIGSIDQGTSSSRFLIFSEKGRIVASAQRETTQYYPRPGWHEHDPMEIWLSVVQCVEAISAKTTNKALTTLQAIGITNQRETTVAWNNVTGLPYHNAIVWDDLRTSSIAQEVSNQEEIRKRTGLPVASYFAGTKVKWLMDNVPQLQKDLQDKPHEVCFGTVDTWLTYQLTGQKAVQGSSSSNQGGLFVTDATNASRWLFMDLTSQKWDKELVQMVTGGSINLPLSCLPSIHPSSHLFGRCSNISTVPKILHNVPLAAILGDQQAALFGQTCFQPGEAKNTYGTGLFLMMVTGEKPVVSTHGLLTTIGYQIGAKTTYALEGSVAHSGSTIQWLRDQLQIISTASDSEKYAAPDSEGVYFVPAFAGLFAPYWRPDARACIVGMTSSHGKGHVCRATLEAIAYQTKDVFDAIEKDSNVSLKSLRVDGGGTANRLLMQFQADIINVPVTCPVVLETTALGAAFAAGLAVGIWKDLDEISSLWSVAETYQPNMSLDERRTKWVGWKKAVGKSLGWVETDGDKLRRMESKIIDGEFLDTYSDADALIRAIELADRKWTSRGIFINILSQVVLTAAAVTVGYLLGERRPGMLSVLNDKLPKLQGSSSK